jgi:hypothetical protein
MKGKLFPYVPGVLLFVFALVIGLLTYKDYGMGWDEPDQRGPGVLSYDYIFHGSQELFLRPTDNHGAGFELFLVLIEKGLKQTDSREIYMTRHIVSHIFFLVAVLAGYVLIYKLFKNVFLACLGFVMLAFDPRIYAHSFFNSKDLPFLAMIIISLAAARWAFAKNKPLSFLILGLACGYATSIRIMGVMLAVFMLGFLLLDLLAGYKKKEQTKRILINSALYTAGFCFALYIAWPYLWKAPIRNFVDSFSALSHYAYDAEVLFGGTNVKTTNLPWTYFPTWFIITNPVLWLIFGCVGLVRLLLDVLKKPSQYLKNTPDRNFLLFLLCFWAPIIAVIGLNSVIYDDWRHLYFVYPPFVFIAIYMVHRIMQMLPSKFSMVVPAICAVQAAVIGLFMVKNFPFSQVYFNELVSHEKEYLRENYELEYWGCGFKQALDHLVTTDTAQTIHIACNYNAPLSNNIMMLPAAERKRIEIIPIPQISKADYFVTNFRGHPEDYPSKNIGYSVSVLNSTILCVYDLKKK